MTQSSTPMQMFCNQVTIFRKSGVMFRKLLIKPLTVKLLDASREYWLRYGVSDWGLVIDEEV